MQRLESSVHSNNSNHGKLLFYVTVFNMEENTVNYGLKTNMRWVWELHNKHLDGMYATRFLFAVCAGAIRLPTCYPGPQEKAEKVFMMCGGGGNSYWVGVICWGCNL